MKDPYVAEVRKYRMLHTRQFNYDLRLICEDLRDFESKLGVRVLTLTPRRIQRTRNSRLPRIPLGV
jgi:hypothetical protein